MANSSGPQANVEKRNCVLSVFAYAGAAFIAIAASADNLVKYLFGPGFIWIIGGTYVTGVWAYQKFCKGKQEDE